MQESSWFVLHVKSNQEKRVAQHLAARSLEHFLPLYTVRNRWTDRTVVLEKPLFPGYIFTRFLNQDRLSVISTPGVIRSLGDDFRHQVSAEEIEKIRRGLAAKLALRPHAGILVGTHVRVRAGVFEGMEGTVKELRDPCRVTLSLTGTHQCFSVEVRTDELEVLKASAVAPPSTVRLRRPICC